MKGSLLLAPLVLCHPSLCPWCLHTCCCRPRPSLPHPRTSSLYQGRRLPSWPPPSSPGLLSQEASAPLRAAGPPDTPSPLRLVPLPPPCWTPALGISVTWSGFSCFQVTQVGPVFFQNPSPPGGLQRPPNKISVIILTLLKPTTHLASREIS